MRRLIVPILSLCVGCQGLSGDWKGECDYVNKRGNPHHVDLRVSLEDPNDDGFGKGKAWVSEDGAPTERYDLKYQVDQDVGIDIDVYLPDDFLFLRGAEFDGRLEGSCASVKPTEVDLDGFVDCLFDLTLCDVEQEWKPRKGEIAPVTPRDLDGEFLLRRPKR